MRRRFVTAAVLTAPAVIVLAQFVVFTRLGLRSCRLVAVTGSLVGICLLVAHMSKVFYASHWWFCQVTKPSLGMLDDILSYRVSRKCYIDIS